MRTPKTRQPRLYRHRKTPRRRLSIYIRHPRDGGVHEQSSRDPFNNTVQDKLFTETTRPSFTPLCSL